MTETDSETVDVEQFAGDTVRLTTAITRVLNAPDIVEGEVSASGKTIAVEHPNREGKTFRLDTASIMAGESEFRDSRSFTLYTREDFQSTQSANYGPGPQAGANGVSDAADLPEPTHTPVGEGGQDEQGGDDDPGADGDEGGEDGRDEFGRIQKGERVHVTGETDDGTTLDARGTVTNVTGTETTVELDDGRTVRKKASVIKGRTRDGKPLYFRNPTMSHLNGGAEGGSPDANPGDDAGKTVMTDGGEDVEPDKPSSDHGDVDSANAWAKVDETELLHLLEMVQSGDDLKLNQRSRALDVLDVQDDEGQRVIRLKGNGTRYSVVVERDASGPSHAVLQYPSGQELVTHAKVEGRNALMIDRYDQLLTEELESVAPSEHVDRMMGHVERSPDRTWSDLSERDRTGEWVVEGDELTAVKWAIHAFVAHYREGGRMGASDDTLTYFQNALALWERVRGEWDTAHFVGSEFGHLGACLDYAVEDRDIRERVPDAVIDGVAAVRAGEDVPDLPDVHPEDSEGGEDDDGEDDPEDMDINELRIERRKHIMGYAMDPAPKNRTRHANRAHELETELDARSVEYVEHGAVIAWANGERGELPDADELDGGEDAATDGGAMSGKQVRDAINSQLYVTGYAREWVLFAADDELDRGDILEILGEAVPELPDVWELTRKGEFDGENDEWRLARGGEEPEPVTDGGTERFWTCPDCGEEISRVTDRMSASAWEAKKDRHREQCDGDGPTARELMDRFGYEPGEPPNPIHGEVTGELDRYGHPYVFIGSREAYSARKDWKQRLDAAGYEYHHPEDGRFSEGVDVRTVVVTGYADDPEPESPPHCVVCGSEPTEPTDGMVSVDVDSVDVREPNAFAVDTDRPPEGTVWVCHGCDPRGDGSDACTDGGEDVQDGADGDGWDPSPVALRDGETRDVDSHARRNAEQLRIARQELKEAGELDGDDGDGPDARTDGGVGGDRLAVENLNEAKEAIGDAFDAMDVTEERETQVKEINSRIVGLQRELKPDKQKQAVEGNGSDTAGPGGVQ